MATSLSSTTTRHTNIHTHLEVEDLLTLVDETVHGCPRLLTQGTLQLPPPPAGLVQLADLPQGFEWLFVHLRLLIFGCSIVGFFALLLLFVGGGGGDDGGGSGCDDGVTIASFSTGSY